MSDTNVESRNSSTTHQEVHEDSSNKLKVEATLESLEDDWDKDPANPRNWSTRKKWVSTAVASILASLSLVLQFIFFIYRYHFTHWFLHWAVQ